VVKEEAGVFAAFESSQHPVLRKNMPLTQRQDAVAVT
jgi:hypothetical protein